ncbi:5'/3'-nucleotidase SurE [Prosthecochloris sp. HL-130-GSB]|jgi:5'-nucleotidase|uniref:5'/3'-nucleotidase SurE n=1 Tax=Prosthecochloris sp. HL-130-GSB TaxID=1974213 RepID=UPI000A1C080C|nr:5'/3'-nucleotidase SurE [Prosthecochloris sp. HL-130-GSB]ARM31453.1 5'/3'-nucleotidase SurE [Prosthecochloris sp. HL-130-GSB]MBO8092887.1 5'/3'-nucleotidase SurE [Prosthecochloris sp.]
MTDNKPHILVCNDDGIDAEGIHALAASMKKLGRVTVVAPSEPHSGMGHAMTLGVPLRIGRYHKNNRFFGYTVSGTPVDCVKVALSHILDEKPDLLVSGINYGSNTATNTLYSGTVGAALEGRIQRIPSLAFSLTTYENADFTYSAKFARKLARKVLREGLPPDTILSVNIPNVPEPEIRGVAVTRQGKSRWAEDAIEREDMYGNPYYWLSGRLQLLDSDMLEDEYAVRQNYVAITPIAIDMTNHEALKPLKQWKLKK